MKFKTIGGMNASRIVMGCMRLHGMTAKDTRCVIDAALEQGVNFFDHADCYGNGESEHIFAEALKSSPSLRDKIYLQSKCGIVKSANGSVGYYNFSKKHILESVDGILSRLNTDYIDSLLLHRPDPLLEPEEVAEAFNELHAAGKVRYFGVSNQSPMLIELLQKQVQQPLLFNQLQFSIAHTPMLDHEIYFNMGEPEAVDRTSEVIEYSRLKGMTIQTWSPFQHGFFGGVFLDNPEFPELNAVLERLAKEKNATKSGIAVAWILRHPAQMQVIAGTTKPSRMKEICQGTDVALTREEWYEIYIAGGHKMP